MSTKTKKQQPEVITVDDGEEEDGQEEEEEEDEDAQFGPNFKALFGGAYSLEGSSSESVTNPFKFLTVDGRERAVVRKLVLNRPFIKAVPRALNSPHGCVDFYQGRTRVLVGVFGPTDVRMAKEVHYRAAIDLIFRHKTSSPGGHHRGTLSVTTLSERTMEQRLTSLLEKVVVLDDLNTPTGARGLNCIVHEMHDDGGLFCVCVNALCLALLEGGSVCSLRSTFAAVVLSINEYSGEMTFHPATGGVTGGAKKIQKPNVIEVVYANDQRILLVNTSGGMKLPRSAFTTALAVAWEAAKEIFEFYETFVTTVHKK